MGRKSINFNELINELEKPGTAGRCKKTTSIPASDETLLAWIEAVVEITHDSNLSDEALTQALPYLRKIGKFLSLTPSQSMLMSVFMDQCNDTRINLSDLGRHFGCRNIRMIRMTADITALAEKRYIRMARHDGDQSFRVPREVINAIKENRLPVPKTYGGLSLEEMFMEFNDIFEETEHHELSTDELMSTVQEILTSNPDTTLSVGIAKLDLRPIDKLVFLKMAQLLVDNNDNAVNFSDLEDLLDCRASKSCVKNMLNRGESSLFRLGLIENSESGGFGDRTSFRLTEKAKKELLGALYTPDKPEDLARGLTKHESLAEKKLFYNKEEEASVAQLKALLSQEQFVKITDRLSEKGLRKGFACLFYGSPGTGKTETVYQIAKATGRNIMQVNISQLKSCWVGESEKNVKAIFERYRSQVEKGDIAPILLFNEADAIIGQRMENTTRAVDKMENAIQNILLEEMEKLEGILIATTNLTANLDKAFERRFLYKINFGRPNDKARAAIWRAMMPDIKESTAAMLGRTFDLSGGQIENIARRLMVEGILNGFDTIDDERIKTLCAEEAKGYSGSSHSKVGFSASA